MNEAFIWETVGGISGTHTLGQRSQILAERHVRSSLRYPAAGCKARPFLLISGQALSPLFSSELTGVPWFYPPFINKSQRLWQPRKAKTKQIATSSTMKNSH